MRGEEAKDERAREGGERGVGRRRFSGSRGALGLLPHGYPPVSNGKGAARDDESDGREQCDTPGAVAPLSRRRRDAGEGAQRHGIIVAARRDEGLALGRGGHDDGDGDEQSRKK